FLFLLLLCKNSHVRTGGWLAVISDSIMRYVKKSICIKGSRGREEMDKDILIRLLSLNLGIAAANIVVFSPGLLDVDIFGAGALEAAFGIAFLVLSGSGLVYGNYELLSVPEKATPIDAKSTKEDYM